MNEDDEIIIQYKLARAADMLSVLADERPKVIATRLGIGSTMFDALMPTILACTEPGNPKHIEVATGVSDDEWNEFLAAVNQEYPQLTITRRPAAPSILTAYW